MELRDYQIEISTAACELLKKHKIAYLSMQVRTGKTLTSFETAKKYGANKVLFVTKKKAIDFITEDYLKMYANYFKLWVINYESLHKLGPENFDLVIVDEAHSLGQFPVPAERTKQLKHICRELPIIYLSGTPSPESYSQLYHQFWVSSYSPFEEDTFYKWAKSGYVFLKFKYLYNRQINDYSEANLEKIDAKVKHLFLSYTQEQAGFEVLVNEVIHKVKMSNKTYNLCKRLRLDKIVVGKDGDVIEADTEVKLMNKLHQIYSGTVLFEDNTKKEGAIIDDAKLVYIFDNFMNQKKAIFYKFRTERVALEVYCKNHGLNYTDDPHEFQNNDDIVFLSQFVSGREGINLSTADCLICYNIDFSAITYFQVRARLQTKDRKIPAPVHWIFAENGIEQQIYRAVSNKKNYTLSYFVENEKKIKL